MVTETKTYSMKQNQILLFQKFPYLHHRGVLPPWYPEMLSYLTHDPPRCPVAHICHHLNIDHISVWISIFIGIIHGRCS